MKEQCNDIIKDISELIKIPTVYDAATATEGIPFGEKVFKGLQWLKEKALADGFEVLEYDGYAIAIRIPGNVSESRIDVVSHADVVEPGGGWKEDPFSGTITDEYIYGRGAQDMKGSLIMTYHALKYIKDNNIPLKRELRVVIGSDEERTMGDMKYYVKKAGEPAFAFTPDGMFPYSLGEKGALMWSIEGNSDTCIEELDGGVQCNVVSPSATALLSRGGSLEDYRELISNGKYHAEVNEEGGKIRINVKGKAAHASRPHQGDNATVRLLDLIRCVSHDPLAELLYKCFCNYYGEGAGIAYDIKPMGKLTLNLGVLKVKDKTVRAEIDCRYPYGITSDILTEKLQMALTPLQVALKYDDRPTLADKKSPYLKILLNTYRKISGKWFARPFISSGVTYGKVFANCVAFGPITPNEPTLVHQADERLYINKIPERFKIYTEAMIRLATM